MEDLKSSPLPYIGITTTSKFRTEAHDHLVSFSKEILPWLFGNALLIITQQTFEAFLKIIERESCINLEEFKKNTIVYPSRTPGMVRLTVDIIEGKLSAIFHLSLSEDISNHSLKVLKRQTMVHKVIHIDDLPTATALVQSWKEYGPLKPKSYTANPYMDKFKNKSVLSLIAHNGKKLEMCELVIEFMDVIFKYDYIICTGTTGGLIKRFLTVAAKHIPNGLKESEIDERIIRFQSGPLGGDVQIANVILHGYCHDVVFLIDALEAQPHEPDIGFFQEVLQKQETRLTTDTESSRWLLRGKRSKQ